MKKSEARSACGFPPTRQSLGDGSDVSVRLSVPGSARRAGRAQGEEDMSALQAKPAFQLNHRTICFSFQTHVPVAFFQKLVKNKNTVYDIIT